MNIDSVGHEQAHVTVEYMHQNNHELMWLATLPHKIGVAGFLGTALFSPFIVWHANTAIWFQENFVAGPNISSTNDMAIPQAEDLQTALETGIWTWNWMDAPVGAACFIFVALAYTRSQMHNLRWRPYTDKIRQLRARRLVGRFPQYNTKLVENYSLSDEW